MITLSENDRLELASLFASPLTAAQNSDKTYKTYGWIKWFDEELMKWFYQSQSQLGGLTCPPDSGKSYYLSGWVPPWHLFTNPNDDLIAVTHSAAMAKKFGGWVRDNLISMGNLIGEKIVDEKASITDFTLTGWNNSRFRAIGRGARILSEHPRLMIMDDLIGEIAETESATTMARLDNKFSSDYLSRLGMHGRGLFSMQRLGDNDLFSKVKEIPGATIWELPAVPVPGEVDPLGRKPNTPLAPDRYSYEWLQDREVVIGEDAYWTSYMCKPRNAKNKPFSRDKLVEFSSTDGSVDINDQVLFGVMDCAYTDNPTADYTVLQIWGYDKLMKNLYLWDSYREQLKSPIAQTIIENYWAKYPNIVKMYIEGPAVYDQAKENGFKVELLKPAIIKGSKWARAQVAGMMVREGRIFINHKLPGKMELYAELDYFPDVRVKDDQADCFSYAARLCTKVSAGGFVW